MKKINKMFNLVSIQTNNIARTLAIRNPSIITRTLKNELQVKWTRPEKPQSFGKIRSGDLKTYIDPDPSNICIKYQYATELDE